jgi:hypothetical protein
MENEDYVVVVVLWPLRIPGTKAISVMGDGWWINHVSTFLYWRVSTFPTTKSAFTVPKVSIFFGRMWPRFRRGYQKRHVILSFAVELEKGNWDILVVNCNLNMLLFVCAGRNPGLAIFIECEATHHVAVFYSLHCSDVPFKIIAPWTNGFSARVMRALCWT